MVSLLVAQGEQRALDQGEDQGLLKKRTLSGISVTLLSARNGFVWFESAQ
jgi:hypothetical protein